MYEMNTDQRPIGFWLKHLDGQIEQVFDHVLAERDLHRRHWQVLNTMCDGRADQNTLAEGLRPFWTDGETSIQEVLQDLVDRGWLRADGTDYTITEAGQRARADLLGSVAKIRRAMFDGFTEDEYSAIVASLARMSANLEQALTPVD